MINRCRGKSLIKGLGCRDEANTIMNLQYADDNFREECLPQAMILK